MKATEKGVGYDAAKKTKGIKRNVIVDTIGLLLGIAVIPANIQEPRLRCQSDPQDAPSVPMDR